MSQLQFIESEDFKEINEKLRTIAETIMSDKELQVENLKLTNNAKEFEEQFEITNKFIKKNYEEYEKEITDAINEKDLTDEQGDRIISDAQGHYKQWNDKLDELKDFVANHIKTYAKVFGIKIEIPGLIKRITDLISADQALLKKTLDEVEKKWETKKDANILEKIEKAFAKKQKISNRVPYNEGGKLWKNGDIVTIEQLGIRLPDIPEVSLVNFKYVIHRVDLPNNTVDVNVTITKNISKSTAEKTFEIEIKGFEDYSKFERSKLLEFVEKFKTDQDTKKSRQKIFNWKINQSEGVDKDFLGIEEPENKIGIELKYTIDDIDFNTGVVKVDLKASKNHFSNIIHITIKGFYAASSDIQKLKNELKNLEIKENAIDLQQALEVKHTWLNVTYHIKNYLLKPEKSFQKEMINNLEFTGDSLICQDLNEKIIDGINLHQEIIDKVMRVKLGNYEIGKPHFYFKNYFHIDQVRKQAVENFASKFKLKQETHNSQSTEPLFWKYPQSEGIFRDNLGIVEPINLLETNIKYSTLSQDIANGKIVVKVEISGFNHTTEREITISEFNWSKNTFIQIKKDLKNISNKNEPIDLEWKIMPKTPWEDFTDFIWEKLKQIKPLNSYQENDIFLKNINLTPVENINEESKNSKICSTGIKKSFRFCLGNLELGVFDYCFKGFKTGNEEIYNFHVYDEDGNPKQDQKGNFERSKFVLSYASFSKEKSVSKKFLIFNNINDFIPKVEGLQYLYESIKLKNTSFEIRENDTVQTHDLANITLIEMKNFKLNQKIILYQDWFNKIFPKSPAELSATFSVNAKKQFFVTFRYYSEFPKSSTTLWTTLLLGSLEFVPKINKF